MYTLDLDSSYKHRLLAEIHVAGKYDKPYCIDCIIDTGCINTLIDETVLRNTKHTELGFSRTTHLAGKSFSANAVVLLQVDFGGLKADKVIVFAAPLVGTPVYGRMLLGLNTMNNWIYTVKRTSHVIEFSESQSLPMGAKAKNRYTNYFDLHGKYVLVEAH